MNFIKVKVSALVVRKKDTNKIIDAIPLNDIDDEVDVMYYPEDIKSIDEIKIAIKDWEEDYKKIFYYKYIEGLPFIIHSNAKHMPSIGNILVQIESKEITWE